MMQLSHLSVLLVFLGLSCSARPIAPLKALAAKPLPTLSSVQVLEGLIRFDDDQFTLRLDDKHRFVNAQDTRRLLAGQGIFAAELLNSQDLRGMIVASEFLEKKLPWGIIMTVNYDGHVEPASEPLDSNSLLQIMRNSLPKNRDHDDNVVGIDWAVEPRFDPLAHTVYWAKNLMLAKPENSNITYIAHSLGRESNVQFTSIVKLQHLEAIGKSMQTMLAFGEFDVGARYQDFHPRYNRQSSSSLKALIVGEQAAKPSLWHNLWAKLPGSKKFLIFSAMGLVLIIARKKKPEF